ncbi:hypothetical protein [Glaciimonas sp. PCH181]|uniref:hypothetical protein n=1 Tax=Glaciimonas sp. PCH181 TaxID=2133943 RepID=UPI0011B28303|nr:hypothetical protein [Glaciimonas sp. PCH181]
MLHLFGHRLSQIRKFPKIICGGVCLMAAQMVAAQAVPAAPAAPVQPISPAEVLLFQTNHLQNISKPQDLTYTYKKIADSKPAVSDEVHVDVTKINPDGSASVSLRFLTGTRKLEIPEMEHAQGNPILLGFLEWDIAQMQQQTGGSSNYFRRRIRLALAGAAQVKPITFTYKGKPLAGSEVSIQPYLNDPQHERLGKFVNKRYTFVLSDKVSGGVYQIATAVPAGKAAPAGAPAAKPQDLLRMEETLTLAKEENSKH